MKHFCEAGHLIFDDKAPAFCIECDGKTMLNPGVAPIETPAPSPNEYCPLCFGTGSWVEGEACDCITRKPKPPETPAQTATPSPAANVEWINEDELPNGYPYDEMFPHSKLGRDGRGGVRIFPKVEMLRGQSGTATPSPTDNAGLCAECGKPKFGPWTTVCTSAVQDPRYIEMYCKCNYISLALAPAKSAADTFRACIAEIHNRMYSLGASGELTEANIHAAIDIAHSDWKRLTPAETPVGTATPSESISGERWLALRGFADSRNYSGAEIGQLLDEFAESKIVGTATPVETQTPGATSQLLTKEPTMARATPVETASPDLSDPTTWPEIGRAPASPSDVPDDVSGPTSLELVDYATGIAGTYCIGRKEGIFASFWNPAGWAGSGQVFTDKRLAEAVMNLESQLTQVQAKYSKAMRALESLTPSGSEFVGDVERCVAHVRESQASQHRVILSFSKRAKAAELELTQVREELRQAKMRNESLVKGVKSDAVELGKMLETIIATEERAGKAEAENKRLRQLLETDKIPQNTAEQIQEALHSSTPEETNG